MILTELKVTVALDAIQFVDQVPERYFARPVLRLKCGKFLAKTTFSTRTGFYQERYALVIQGIEDGAQASFELSCQMPGL